MAPESVVLMIKLYCLLPFLKRMQKKKKRMQKTLDLKSSKIILTATAVSSSLLLSPTNIKYKVVINPTIATHNHNSMEEKYLQSIYVS